MKKVKILGVVLAVTISLSVFGVKAYANTNGKWMKDSIGWTYQDASGKNSKGWIKDNGTWYFMDNSAHMKTGWIKDSNKWYFLDNSGAMKTGWIKDNNKWYYLDESGTMKTGWLEYNKEWYFLNSSGDMRSGWLKSGNDWYYLSDKGSMCTSGTVDGWKILSNGVAVSEITEDIAKKLIIEQDGEFFNSLIKSGGKLQKGHVSDKNMLNTLKNSWGMKEDEYLEFDVIDNEVLIAKYLVSKTDCFVYRAPNQGGAPIYLMVRNNIMQEYFYIDNSENSRVRQLIQKEDGIYLNKSIKYGYKVSEAKKIGAEQLRVLESAWNIKDEDFMEVIVTDEYVDGNIYVVSLKTGNVYRVPSQGGEDVYLMKDNKIAKTFKYVQE